MDWVKAKNIIIVLFIALNVYLAVNIILYYKNNGISQETIIEVKKLLSNDGIILNCEIPNNTVCFRLNYKNAESGKTLITEKLLVNVITPTNKIEDGKVMTSGSKSLEFGKENTFNYVDTNPQDSVNISSYDEVIEYSQDFMYAHGISFSDYFVESYQTNKDSNISLRFIEKYKGYLVYNNFAEITVSSKGIRGLKYGKVELLSLGKTQIEIVPAYKILIKNLIGGKSKIISSIDIGFNCTYPSEGTNYDAVPEWRIRTNDGKVQYFTAVG